MDIIYKLISTVYCGQVVTDVTPAFRENMRKRKEQQRSAPSLGRFVVTHRSRWLAYKTTFFMDQSIFKRQVINMNVIQKCKLILKLNEYLYQEETFIHQESFKTLNIFHIFKNQLICLICYLKVFYHLFFFN